MLLGEINCTLDIPYSNKNSKIIGDEYEKNSKFDIYIDDVLIKYSKQHLFETNGKHNMTIKLYEKINMDYMFKEVEDLTEVNMTSEKNCEITSMVSTFEKCEKLFRFNISGFGAKSLKSMMKKMLYKTNLYYFTVNSFDMILLIKFLKMKSNYTI